MEGNNLFNSDMNCDFLYKVIQENVHQETNVDIKRNPKYYTILKNILKTIQGNTKPEEQTLQHLNNLVVNKSIPYFCQMARQENQSNIIVNNNEHMNDTKPLLGSLVSNNNNGLADKVKALDTFKSVQDNKNKLQNLHLQKKKLNDKQNLRLSILKGGNTSKLNSNKQQEHNAFQHNPENRLNNTSVGDNRITDEHIIEGFQDTGTNREDLALNRAIVENTTPSKKDVIFREHLLCIDSKDASGSNYYPYSFIVDINTQRSTESTHTATITNIPLRNVVEIEVMSCIVPKLPFNDTSGNRYLILKIDEVVQAIHGTNSDLTNALAILVPDREYIEGSEINLSGDANSETTIRKFVLCKNLYPKKKYYGTPLAQLNRLTINFYNQDGNTKNGTDANWSTHWTDHTNILLKVTTKEFALSN